MSLQILDDFSEESLAKYLTKVVNDYNDDGYIYDLYYTSTANVMTAGSGYVSFGSIQNNMEVCLDASPEAQNITKLQTETTEVLMEETSHLTGLSTEFREATNNFKQN